MKKFGSYINHTPYITFDKIKVLHIIPKDKDKCTTSKNTKMDLKSVKCIKYMSLMAHLIENLIFYNFIQISNNK